MNTKLVGMVRFDFCPASKKEELLDSLETLFGQEVNTVCGVALGSGTGWTLHQFKASPDDKELSKFESVDVYLEPDGDVVDVITVARLGKDQMDDVEEAETNKAHGMMDDFRDSLNAISDYIPTIVNKRDGEPVITYIEPDQHPQVVRESEDVVSGITEFLDQNSDLLNKYEFNFGGFISLFKHEDILAPKAIMQPWHALTAVNVSSTHDDSKELKTKPIWVKRLSSLRSIFRAYFWSRTAIRDLSDLGTQMHGTDSLTEDIDTDEFADIIELNAEVDQLQEWWTDTYTRTVDELFYVKHGLEGYQEVLEDGNGSFPPDTEIVIPPLTSGANAANPSLLTTWMDSLEQHIDRVELVLEQTEKKHDTLTDYVHDKLQSKTAKTNVNLQNRVKNLTWIIAILTVIMVGMTGILVANALGAL